MSATGNPVMTVRGPVPAGELGHVQPHEHVFMDISWARHRWDLCAFTDEVQMTEEVRRYRAAGGGTLVEVTCLNIGRNPEGLRRVSEATGVHIVMGTGWYREPYYPEYIERTATASLAAMLVEEIEHGYADTGIRPGIIGEIGVDKRWVQGVEERVLRAAARAQRRTGLALTTHTPPFAAAQMWEILAEEGVDPARVVFGHVDNTLELPYLLEILRTGCWLQFDLIGLDGINSDDRRARVLVDLARQGYLDRLLISCDLAVRARLSTNGGHGYQHLIEGFLPLLARYGLTDDDIHQLTHTNPQRMLAG